MAYSTEVTVIYLAGDNITRENMAVVIVRAFDQVEDMDLVTYVAGQDFKKDVTDLQKRKLKLVQQSTFLTSSISRTQLHQLSTLKTRQLVDSSLHSYTKQLTQTSLLLKHL